MDLHNREENYKYKNLSLTVIAKALDDICPKYENEPQNIRDSLIKERISFFAASEKALDKEWNTLNKEADKEVANLNKERTQVIKKLERTKKTARIKLKVKSLERNRDKRIKYLQNKLKNESLRLTQQLKTLNPTTKKYKQIKRKSDRFTVSINTKIETAKERYTKIINNTLASDNSANVDERIKQSKKVWDKKFKKLERQFHEKETIHNNKRIDDDQIRLAVQGFVEERDRINHWCLMIGINPRICYQEVQDRLKLLGRNSLEIDELVREWY